MKNARRVVSKFSLRLRLVAVVMVTLTIAMVAASALTLRMVRQELYRQTDQSLEQTLKSIGRGYSFERNCVNPRRRGQLRIESRSPYDISFSVDGVRQYQCSSFAESMPDVSSIDMSLVPVSGQIGARGRGKSQAEYHTVSSEDASGPKWRVLAVPADRGNQRGTLTIGMSTRIVEDGLQDMRRKLFVMALQLLAGCAILGAVALRGAFSPLRKIECVAAAFAAGDRSQRVELSGGATEVDQVGGSINAMLDEIETTLTQREQSEARMRRFVGDASHELRTPLVSVRGFAELYRHGAVQGEEATARAFRRIEDEATRMSGLVEDLLLLARMDEQRPIQLGEVNLTKIGWDLTQDADLLASDRQIRLTGLDGASVTDLSIVGDDAKLRQVVTNLLTNAVRHTPDGTPIDVQMGLIDDGKVRVNIVDHGNGISDEDKSRIFDRFFRSDESRQRGAGGGSGLGLAIVTAIVAAHDGSAGVTDTPGGGATFWVELPVSGPKARPAKPELPDCNVADNTGT